MAMSSIRAAPDAGASAGRTGGSSAERTTSSCSCMEPALTSRLCAKTSPRCSTQYVCGSESQSKTQLVHMSGGLDFLGFRTQWRRKYGSSD